MDPYMIEMLCQFIETCFTILSGLFLGYVCVGLFIYDSVDDDIEDSISEVEKQYDDDFNYINLYYDKFDEMENIELNKNKIDELRNNYVHEETSRGKVIMTYNSDTESFWYWTNNKNMSYCILDTVARKFSLDYNCKQICVSYKDELNNAHNKIEEDKKNKIKALEELENTGENTGENKKVNVYAQFKSYNVKSSNNAREENTTNIKKYVLADKANRFSYKGDIDSFEKFQNKENSNQAESGNQSKMDFATFKRMILNAETNNSILTQPMENTGSKIKIL
jgi:hypothetical protein